MVPTYCLDNVPIVAHSTPCLYSAQCVLTSVPSVFCSVYSAQCVLQCVLTSVTSVFCPVYSAQCVLTSMFCPVCAAQCVLPSVFCPVCAAQCDQCVLPFVYWANAGFVNRHLFAPPPIIGSCHVSSGSFSSSQPPNANLKNWVKLFITFFTVQLHNPPRCSLHIRFKSKRAEEN